MTRPRGHKGTVTWSAKISRWCSTARTCPAARCNVTGLPARFSGNADMGRLTCDAPLSAIWGLVCPRCCWLGCRFAGQFLTSTFLSFFSLVHTVRSRFGSCLFRMTHVVAVHLLRYINAMALLLQESELTCAGGFLAPLLPNDSVG